MKRIAALVSSWGVILFALAPLAVASSRATAASVDPSSGPADTEPIVTVSGFGDTVEAREGPVGRANLATRLTDADGNAVILLTIPESAPVGPDEL